MNKFLIALAVASITTSAVAAVESSTSTSTSISTETISLQEVAPQAPAAKKWSGIFETENYKTLSNENEAYKGDIEAFEKIEAKYKLTDRDTVSLAQEWSRRYGYNNQQSEETLADTSIRYTRTGYKFPSEISYTAQARVYLPVSDDSKNAGQITQIRVYNNFSKEIAKNLTAGLSISPRLFVQDNAGVDVSGANRFRVLSSASLTYALSDKVSFETTLGVYSKWKNATARGDFLDASTSVYYSPLSWLDLNAGIRQTDGASNLRASGANLYSNTQSEYFLIAGFKI